MGIGDSGARGSGLTPSTRAMRRRASIMWCRTPGGHFAFVLCRPALTKKRPELCTDAPGFDRVAFHKQLNADVLTFFQAHLVDR
jgi:hypothetical protein